MATPDPEQIDPITLSLIVPVKDEDEAIEPFLARVGPILDALRENGAPIAWEILFVDDGSSDNTLARIILANGRDRRIRAVSLSRNFGKEAALTAGIDRARGDVVLLMDADLQHSPALIVEMIAAWRAGADMVYTVRSTRGDESFLKKLGTQIFYRIVNAGAAVEIPANAGDFRLLDRAVVDALKSLPERNRFMKGLYAWVGFRSVAVDYVPDERHAGESSFSMRRLSRLAVTGVTAFTNAPLRLWSALGALIAVGAILGGIWFIIEHYTFGADVPGWATLAVSTMFFSGVQLLSIGILGEYVGRIFDEVKQRPVYLVRHDTGAADDRGPPA